MLMLCYAAKPLQPGVIPTSFTNPMRSPGRSFRLTYPTPVLTASGVTAGSVMVMRQLFNLSVDAKGRVITGAQNCPCQLQLLPAGIAGGDLNGTFQYPTIIT